MAITPEETDHLTALEKGELHHTEREIDEALRRHWEDGVTVKYPQVGWTVGVEPAGNHIGAALLISKG